MGLEDVEPAENFHFFLRPLYSGVLPHVFFFLLFFNLTHRSFQGFRRSVGKKLISHLRAVGESFNLHVFSWHNLIIRHLKDTGGGSRSEHLLG